MTTSPPKLLLYKPESLRLKPSSALSIRALISSGGSFGIEIGCAAMPFPFFESQIACGVMLEACNRKCACHFIQTFEVHRGSSVHTRRQWHPLSGAICHV